MIGNQKRTAGLKSNWALVRYQKPAWEIPIPPYNFFIFFKCQSIYFVWKFIWSWDNTAKTNIKRHRVHWAVLGLGCIRLFVLHTRLNSAFRSVFRFVSGKIYVRKKLHRLYPNCIFYRKAKGSWIFPDTFSDNSCVVCTRLTQGPVLTRKYYLTTLECLRKYVSKNLLAFRVKK